MAIKDFSQFVAHIEQKQEVKEEATNLDEQLKLLKEAVTHIINNTLTLVHEGKNIEKLVEAHQTPLKIEMTDESKQTMEEGRTKMLQREEELFKNHEAAIGRSVQTLETKFKNVVDGFKGFWVDKKTFNRYYWGFIGLLEIAVCALSLLLYYWVKFGAPWNC